MPRKFKDVKATDWFAGKARSAFDYRRNIMNNAKRGRTAVTIGKMYAYYYDPKHKETLPEYDRFPLMIPIEYYDDGFLGLNIHYLSVPERRWLINQLLRYATNTKLNARTKLQLDYATLKSAAAIFSKAKPCIKRYLYDHVRSRFVEITADEWMKVLELPTADWVRK